MKRFYFDSFVAWTLLCFSSCHTITLGPCAFSKKTSGQVTQTVRNHESVHMRQWGEVTALCALVLWACALCGLVSVRWMPCAALFYYLWYGIEWLVRLALTRSLDKAYRAISFEREAYASEHDDGYLTDRPYFAWTRHLKKKKEE